MVDTRCKSHRRGQDPLALEDLVQLSHGTSKVSRGVMKLTIGILTIWIMSSLSPGLYGRMNGEVAILISSRSVCGSYYLYIDLGFPEMGRG